MTPWTPTPWLGDWLPLLALAAVLGAVLYRWLPEARASVRRSLVFLAFWLVADGLAALLADRPLPALVRTVHQLGLFSGGVVLIRQTGLMLFRVVLPALRQQPPRILEDITVILAYLVWALVCLSQAGVELTGLVATSAVITAVLAFAMQDTLGNVLGGLALQLDDSLDIGDWVRLGEVSGQVVQIHWRFTALLTRDGDKVVIPNAQLMKDKFSVIGQDGWRRWLRFQIDAGVNPSAVIAAAEAAVTDAEIDNVHRTRPPSCVALAFDGGAVHYALRYWLVDPRSDDATDSAVRMHLLAALQRHGWPLALDEHALQLHQDDAARQTLAAQQELARRIEALAGIELFASLDEAERRRIAERLVPAPFARGDVMTRQGAAAHWLYILVSGEAEVYWETPTGERRLLSRLPAGNVFGEMGLLTGAPRSATVVARTDVACYRLDKAGFEDVIHGRHALADSMAHILAQRLQHNDELRASFERQQGDASHASRHAAIVQRIRDFFGLA